MTTFCRYSLFLCSGLCGRFQVSLLSRKHCTYHRVSQLPQFFVCDIYAEGKRAYKRCTLLFAQVPPVGLEPTTLRVKAECATNYATEACSLLGTEGAGCRLIGLASPLGPSTFDRPILARATGSVLDQDLSASGRRVENLRMRGCEDFDIDRSR